MRLPAHLVCIFQRSHIIYTGLDKKNFEITIDNKNVSLFVLRNTNGLVAEITNYGGRVVSLWVPDGEGNFDDIVLGYDHIRKYLTSNEIYYGALIGRYGNRISKGKFHLDGKEYQLAVNNGKNHLHGGKRGFGDVVWDAEQLGTSTLKLSYLSKNGEEGYPGNLEVEVIYKLTDDNELTIEYRATTNKATPINLTHHSFFNLRGEGAGTINDHVLQIHADYFTLVDSFLMSTGEVVSVEATPMDFREYKMIGDDLSTSFRQLIFGKGYDHNWIINRGGGEVVLAARVKEPGKGRVMEVYSNEPGLQFYGGNFLDGSDVGKSGRSYGFREAFCLESQHFPDSPNKPHFPSTILRPDGEYYSFCKYKFSCV